MASLPVAERVHEADALLHEASLKVAGSRVILGPRNYEMAQRWLQISRDVKAGMDGKDMPSRYKQAQEYLKKAKETHKNIMQLTSGPYCQ